jgi:hypothetical protein
MQTLLTVICIMAFAMVAVNSFSLTLTRQLFNSRTMLIRATPETRKGSNNAQVTMMAAQRGGGGGATKLDRKTCEF